MDLYGKYDPRDFAANPGKYQLYCTAVIATDILTHNGKDDLKTGQYVGIQYVGTVRNQMYRRNEPVYRIKGTDRTLFANTLCNFVL